MSLVAIANKKISPSQDQWTLEHRNGNTDDIIAVMLKADKEADDYTASFSNHFKFRTIAEFRELWNLVRDNIRYQEDPEGHQIIQSPAQLWKTKIGDCKSFSIFIKSILSNAGLSGGYRFVSYGNDDKVTHVYPWANFNGRRIWMDAVKGASFNRQGGYAYHIDYEWNTGAKIGAPDPAVSFPKWGLLTKITIGVALFFAVKKLAA